jgi:hypothetical protein
MPTATLPIPAVKSRLASASCSEPIAESSEPQRLRPPQFLFAVTTPTEQDGGRPLADEHDVGAAPFGSKSAVFDFDFAFFCFASRPPEPFNPPPQPFNPQFRPFTAKRLTT